MPWLELDTYKKQRKAIETRSTRQRMALARSNVATASEHVGEQTKGGGSGTGTDVLDVGGGGTGGRGRRGSSSRSGRAGAGSGASSARRRRCARRAGAVVGRVQSTALVVDAGGAVGLSLLVVHVCVDAVAESLLADELKHGRSGQRQATG